MPKDFDIATKEIVDRDPSVWLRFCQLPGKRAVLLNTNLDNLILEADRLLRVFEPDAILHLEFQVSRDPELLLRLLHYHTTAHRRHQLPVHSVLVLMRKEADHRSLTGHYVSGGVEFRYQVIRLWEREVEEFLSGPVSLLPLSPLSKVGKRGLGGVVQRVSSRLEEEALVEERELLLLAMLLLLGLRVDKATSQGLMKGVYGMKESSVYQLILEEGIEKGIEKGIKKGLEEGLEKGKTEEALRFLVRVARKRLGEPSAGVLAALSGRTAVEIEQLADRLDEVESWQELLR